MGDIVYMFMYVHTDTWCVCVGQRSTLDVILALLFEKGSLSLGPTACKLGCAALLPSLYLSLQQWNYKHLATTPAIYFFYIWVLGYESLFNKVLE